MCEVSAKVPTALGRAELFSRQPSAQGKGADGRQWRSHPCSHVFHWLNPPIVAT